MASDAGHSAPFAHGHPEPADCHVDDNAHHPLAEPHALRVADLDRDTPAADRRADAAAGDVREAVDDLSAGRRNQHAHSRGWHADHLPDLQAALKHMSDWIRSILMARLADVSADEGRERRLSALREIFDLDLPVDDWPAEKARLNRRFDDRPA